MVVIVSLPFFPVLACGFPHLDQTWQSDPAMPGGGAFRLVITRFFPEFSGTESTSRGEDIL
ncbi:hypothetical protein AU468_09130 [Alkalispirochaeta sphaeroplastigenens]|uniref:Uncharacterized protein n=1 Tax=Alkalispirochaeta sphaeroplastigenens TaxID=1187066 RepID=A0A2S4JNB3_9SPIO|nr:hypothetical protein AU468_09130 [Alkalispirochaeta sphaeroplastigenens]